jgi:Fe-S-cluster containining protein
MIDDTDKIEQKVREAGFSCLSCGACCRGIDNEVMISPLESEILAEETGLCLDDIIEPYPEWIHKEGVTFTFGWVLQRDADGNCIFLENDRCRVYRSRPHICRTYPFMLDEENFIISECPGRETCDTTVDPKQIVGDLLLRRAAEDIELEKTEKQYKKYNMITDSIIVFDGNGAHEYSIHSKKP